jgi:hypothetical protein
LDFFTRGILKIKFVVFQLPISSIEAQLEIVNPSRPEETHSKEKGTEGVEASIEAFNRPKCQAKALTFLSNDPHGKSCNSD